MTNRLGPIPDLCEQLDQPGRRRRVEWTNGGETLPVLDGADRVFLSLGVAREALQRRHGSLLEVGSAHADPMLELDRVRQKESVEEWAIIHRDGCVELSGILRALEVPDVARDSRSVQSDRATGEEQVVRAERTARGVQRLRQRVARALEIDVWPEQPDELVARDATLTTRGDDYHQRERTALIGGIRNGIAMFVGDADAAKCAKSKHLVAVSIVI